MNKKGKLPPLIERDDSAVVIFEADDGIVVKYFPEGRWESFRDSVEDDSNSESGVRALVDAFRSIVEHFNKNASRYAKYRILVDVEAGDKYFLRPGEKFKREWYRRVIKKGEGDEA